jgi:hypothetical protein
VTSVDIASIVLSVLPLIVNEVGDVQRVVPSEERRSRKEGKMRRKVARDLQYINTALRTAMYDIFDLIDLSLTKSQWSVLKNEGTKGAEYLLIWEQVVKAKPNQGLNDALKEIREVLEQIEDILMGMVAPAESSVHEGRVELLRILMEDEAGTLSIRDHFNNVLNFTNASPEQAALLEEMKETIELLTHIIETQKKKAKFIERDLWRSRNVSCLSLEDIRSHSDNLHVALSKTWKCRKCHKSPSAMLRLEKRKSPEDWNEDNGRFSLVLLFEHPQDGQGCDTWNFHEAEVCVNLEWIPLHINVSNSL